MSPFRLTLGELMLWIASIAVCLWAATVATILGLVAALVLVPILGRASRIVHRRSALGRPVDSTTWVLAIAGSIGPVFSTWILIVGSCLFYSAIMSALLLLCAWIFPGFRDILPANWDGVVMRSVGLLGACATFYISAVHSLAIREREVGRVPGPSRHSDATGENPAHAASPGG